MLHFIMCINMREFKFFRILVGNPEKGISDRCKLTSEDNIKVNLKSVDLSGSG